MASRQILLLHCFRLTNVHNVSLIDGDNTISRRWERCIEHDKIAIARVSFILSVLVV